MPSRLSRLQERVLELLAGIDPPWTLSGGGALAGFHLGHRPTRDLDLFWHGRGDLAGVREEVQRVLRAAGLQVESLHRSPAFERLRVGDGRDVLVLDLVAEPVPTVEAPATVRIGSASIRVDTPHEILVNKLCALLNRAELRDLVDVRGLLEHGGDLERALTDAPRKDGGFSPLTVAWLLRDLPIASLAEAAGIGEREVRDLAAFRGELVARITRAAAPERGG